ncbi:hypothetical protein EJ06DRAFT_531894 [Trichodelitschia bisporula]|uniref:Uncharacterized protein n=1 Tax=Trichodelitschia bisporula TaxID=703511 RepID=A0A6G1HSH7_9PEZI|nr:hypothetical protein EJ06DRAFT_531894 [Trichodelitschia bisporula]
MHISISAFLSGAILIGAAAAAPVAHEPNEPYRPQPYRGGHDDWSKWGTVSAGISGPSTITTKGWGGKESLGVLSSSSEINPLNKRQIDTTLGNSGSASLGDLGTTVVIDGGDQGTTVIVGVPGETTSTWSEWSDASVSIPQGK